MDNKDNDDDGRIEPSLFDDKEDIRADVKNRLVNDKPKCWLVKTRILLWFFILLALLYLLRSGIVFVYGGAETYYNRLGLSGYDNMHNLEFVNVSVDGHDNVMIKADIVNNGMFATKVPAVMIEGGNKTFEPKQKFLKPKEKTLVEIKVDEVKGINSSFNIKFVR